MCIHFTVIQQHCIIKTDKKDHNKWPALRLDVLKSSHTVLYKSSIFKKLNSDREIFKWMSFLFFPLKNLTLMCSPTHSYDSMTAENNITTED